MNNAAGFVGMSTTGDGGAESGRGMREDLLLIIKGALRMKKQPRRSAVGEATIYLLTAMLTAAPAAAQQVTGESGSPSATTTIDGKHFRHCLHNSAE